MKNFESKIWGFFLLFFNLNLNKLVALSVTRKESLFCLVVLLKDLDSYL